MPEVSNHGIKISYDVIGQGRPLVLLHGRDPRPGTYEDWVTVDEGDLESLRREGMQAIIDRYEDEQFQFPDAVKVGMLRADPEAMLACQAPELVSEGIPS